MDFYSYKADLSSILNMNCTVAEKLSLLAEYKNDVLGDIMKTSQDVKENFIYCKQCEQWYSKEVVEQTVVREPKEYYSYREVDGCYEPAYIKGLFDVEYATCPAGHKKEVSLKAISHT